MPLSRQLEFSQLFAEFRDRFATAPEGQAHVAFYSRHRQSGQQNFAEIQAAFQQLNITGPEQVPDDLASQLLHKLLPHSDSPTHRDQGYWIHHAPAITGDIQTWYEADGSQWDWKGIAYGIYQWLTGCLASSSRKQWQQYCDEFLALDCTSGLQSEMLTPILNALNPEAFLLVNSKSQKAIAYFSETKCSSRLSDYPKVNRKGHKLIAQLTPFMDEIWQSPLSASDQFDMFCHWLVSLKKYSLRLVDYWKVAPGAGGKYWLEWREQGCISMGWSELGDISSINRKEFDARRDEVISQKPDMNKIELNQIWAFSKIKPGDKIIANRGTTEVLGMGTVTGPYYYKTEAAHHQHRLPVQWDEQLPRRVNQQSWRRKTLQRSNIRTWNRILAVPLLNQAYPLGQCATETYRDEAELQTWIKALNRKGQAVLYGPPGTGKTFLAQKLAQHLLSEGDGFCELVQFHPAYSYEDFVQGIRPCQGKNGLDYPVVPGRFLNFCTKARACSGTAVLIIDELNRANLAQVFGELMYLLEYREAKAVLANGDEFAIPHNVRIIGTMNTADRSIALVDHALRRRFAFLPLYPQYAGLQQFHQQTGFEAAGLIQALQTVNLAIGDRQYALGTSFFLRQDLAADLQSIWQLEIEPYLEEYFFDRPDQVESFRWEVVQAQLLP